MRAVLFDVDGVLINSLPAYSAAWMRWADEYGLPLQTIAAVAHGRRPADIIGLVLDVDGSKRAHALSVFETLLARESGVIQAIPGARALLDALPIGSWAVVTSGARQATTSSFFRLRLPLPEESVFGEDVATGKPDPSCYRLGASRRARHRRRAGRD
jgi:sugar-phosphatase